ncbi:hypothetical protein D3C72_1848590 [compost metagenome]
MASSSAGSSVDSMCKILEGPYGIYRRICVPCVPYAAIKIATIPTRATTRLLLQPGCLVTGAFLVEVGAVADKYAGWDGKQLVQCLLEADQQGLHTIFRNGVTVVGKTTDQSAFGT